MNIIQQQELLKDLSDRDIAGEMQQPSGNVPLYLVAGEAKRRADLRQRFKAEQSGPPPTSTVQEDLLNSIMASQMPATGIAQGIQPQQMPMAPPPQQMQPGMAPPPQQMPAIEPTGEAPMEQIPQAQGIMAGQQGGMAQGFAGGGLVREDRKYPEGGGVRPIWTGYSNPVMGKYLGYDPTYVTPKSPPLSGYKGRLELLKKASEEADIQAQIAQETGFLEATDEMNKAAYLRVPYPTNLPASLEAEVITRPDGSIISRDPLRPVPEDTYYDASPLTSSYLGDQPIVSNAAFNANRPLTADDIARGTDFRGLRDTNTAIKDNRDAMSELKLGENPINFDPGKASTLTVDQISPEDYKGVDPLSIGTRGKVDNPTQTGFNKLKLAEIRKKQLGDLRNANVDPYKNMTARLAERRAALDEDKSGNTAQTLMDLGGRIMAGKSQYGLTNIGEAVSPALKAAQDRKSGQTAREDALLASEMGIISGQRSFDKDIRDQANTIVQDRIKENEMINKETARANTENVDNFNRDVGKKDQAFLDKRFLAVQKKNDQKYNTTQKINLQQARIAEQVRAKSAEQAEINRMANSTNAERRDEARKLQQNLDRKLRILQLRGQSLSETKNDIIRRQEGRETRDFRREILGKTQDFQKKERKAGEEAQMERLKTQIEGKKDVTKTAAKLKDINEKNKRVRTAWKDAIKIAIGTEGGALPPKTDKQAWDNLAGMYRAQLLDSGYPMTVIDALVSDKILRSRGSSGGGVNKVTKQGKVLKYTK